MTKKIFALMIALSLVICVFASCGNDGEYETLENEITYTFKVTHKNGEQKTFEIKTDKKYVGDALEEEGLISGDRDMYGLYVKTVDGEFLDFDTSDGYYWSFIVNSETSMTGVSKTEAQEGAVYEFRATNEF